MVEALVQVKRSEPAVLPKPWKKGGEWMNADEKDGKFIIIIPYKSDYCQLNTNIKQPIFNFAMSRNVQHFKN